jgi:hypothetical protein
MEKTAIKPPPNKPDKLPRQRLSLALTPHLTKAVQAIAKAYSRSQNEVLGDLLRLAVPGLALNLEALQTTYEAAQREALAGVLGFPAESPAAKTQEGNVRGVYGNDPGD